MNAENVVARQVGIGVAITTALFCVVIVGMGISTWVWKADFAVPYTGALILRQGHGARMYSLAEQERVQEALLMRRGLLLDPYPPYHALLFAPLTFLGYRVAYLVWGGVNILLWLFFRYLVREEGARIQPFQFLMLTGLFFPFWLALIQGQFSILLLLSFALAFAYLKQHRDWTAGLALGLGLLKFQIVLPFALIFALRRKWRFLAGLATAAGVVGVLSVVAIGPVGVASYVHLLSDTFRHPDKWAYVTIKPSNMPTIRGFVTGVLGSVVSRNWLTGISAAVSSCLILAMGWLWDEQGSDANLDLLFGASIVVSLLTAPYLYPHDLTPMLLAVTLVVASPEWKRRSKARSLLAVMIAVLYGSAFYVNPLLGREQLYLLAPVLSVFAIAVLSVALAGAHRSGGQPSGHPQAASLLSG